MSKHLIFFLAAILLFSCSQSNENSVTHFNGIKMTVPYRITIGSPLSSRQKTEVQNIIEQTFDEINNIYNKWNPHSEISALNRAEANKEHPLSPALYQFLVQVEELVNQTEGRFDPTIEPMQKLWKNAFGKGVFPSQSEIDTLLPSVGWHHIHLTANGIWKDDSRSSLDLGGIAKGYAIDLIAQRLEKAGYRNLYVEWGGDIAVKGQHPEGRPWRVLVTKWGAPDDTQTVAELKNLAIASSGDYLQNWSIEGNVYTHIFNPCTGEPMKITRQSICSVTVVASNCLLADTIATTAMLFGTKQEAEEWLEHLKNRYPELQYWVYKR